MKVWFVSIRTHDAFKSFEFPHISPCCENIKQTDRQTGRQTDILHIFVHFQILKELMNLFRSQSVNKQ